jgi:hypothetical protein
VAAELSFNPDGDFVDFVSDDRLRASPNGKSFTRRRWSTPVRDYRTVGSRQLFTKGEGRWHAPQPEGEFAYIEFSVDDIYYNVSHARPDPRPHSASHSRRVRHPTSALPPRVLIPGPSHVPPQRARSPAGRTDDEPVVIGVSRPIGR